MRRILTGSVRCACTGGHGVEEADIWRVTEHEMMRSIIEGEIARRMDGVKHSKEQLKYLVAMRLGETPVLIPNTMVKT